MAGPFTTAGRPCLHHHLRIAFRPTLVPPEVIPHASLLYRTRSSQVRTLQKRSFSSSRWVRQQKQRDDEGSFSSRLGKAWRNTRVQWKPIPVAMGIAFLGVYQLWRIQRREAHTQPPSSGPGSSDRPPKRQRIYPSGGGWQVQVMSTLPLKAISRLWGRFNEIDIPYYLRVPGFKLYGWIFGVNFDEVSEPDLHAYPNLAAFFYRTLKPGVRPLDPNPNAVLSPADARVLQFGAIDNGEVEQVKGMTYSLDALLGQTAPSRPPTPHPTNGDPMQQVKANGDHIYIHPQSSPPDHPDSRAIRDDEEFANVNGISYTLPNLFTGASSQQQQPHRPTDASTRPSSKSEAEVTADLATTSAPWWLPFGSADTTTPHRLYYIVVYLAPGDYHRFHSPVSWVCTSRRHFAGELYSVSPYVQRTLPGLFTLNERVALLGRWKYGFFSYTPVGATNVGSIVINFDKELRTNSLTTDTEADRQAAEAGARGEPYSGFSEATYEGASAVLGGHALRRGEEMGGFQLGSSIVLVFEAPSDGSWKWAVERGQKVKVGQALGVVEEETQQQPKE
ncbi:phosphatidylserine decarboxylase [Cyphellophora europaea CBS 101466]|uniref:Phosphatidylserine decarboxylase proenzyme 1, mitochondrial n=1 Tax=Cyphellophora europaea (strain CBS 101466) TaxID=1220924 RepID=W2SEH0_CYPE1|nr:phosphatidylserine decarboxylase [Cyphellophora europaea CBS 101466]ETN46309.1 phosphatidylserine decarboxylase [Cyphellophora europaea CBS 101466]